MKPENLINKTKLYQFLTKSKSRNAIKFNNIPKVHQEKVNNLLKLLEDWMSNK